MPPQGFQPPKELADALDALNEHMDSASAAATTAATDAQASAAAQEKAATSADAATSAAGELAVARGAFVDLVNKTYQLGPTSAGARGGPPRLARAGRG